MKLMTFGDKANASANLRPGSDDDFSAYTYHCVGTDVDSLFEQQTETTSVESGATLYPGILPQCDAIAEHYEFFGRSLDVGMRTNGDAAFKT